MIHFKNLVTVCGLTLLILSCKKEDTPDNNNNNVGTVGFTPQPESKTLSAIFIRSFERDVLPYGTHYLTVFEPNGTVRWKKQRLGSNSQDENIAYGNGMLYFSDPRTTTTDDFYALDINTGSTVWSIINSSEKKYYPVVRNDTLFCSTSFFYPGFGNITAFNARSGALIWRKALNYPYWPVYLKLDGNTLFFIISLTSGTDSKLISFNINTQTVNWESASLGINIASVFSQIAVSDSRVAVKNGTKLMMVFDKNTGATVWTKPGIPFEPPVIHESKMFTYCGRDAYYPVSNDSLMGLYAFDVTTGSQLWKKRMRIEFAATNPFVSGNMLFHSGITKDDATAPEKGYLKGLDVATGNEIWNVATGLTYEQICRHLTCLGNNVYAFKYPSSTGYARIVRYDYSTGQTKDSISIPGESFGKMFLLASDGKVYFPG